MLEVPVVTEWSDVLFVLEGQTDERVRLEVSHPDRTEQVRSALISDFFEVTETVTSTPTSSGPRSERPPPPVAVAVPRGGDWQDAIEDEQFRAVLVHLEQHRSINESELQSMLGPRKTRLFARQVESMAARLPFRVRIESTGAQKVYVKDGSH